MALIKVSDGFKKNFKLFMNILIVLLLISWTVVSMIQMSLNCSILDLNNSNLKDDLGSTGLYEVSDVYTNGNFTLEDGDDGKEYTTADIKDYIRVSSTDKYYYIKKTKSFVAPLTFVEKRNVMLQSIILDILTYIMFAMFLISSVKKAQKRCIVYLILFIVFEFVTFIGYDFAFDVLLNIEPAAKWVFVGKLILMAVIVLVTEIIRTQRAKPKRLKNINKSIKSKRKTTKA